MKGIKNTSKCHPNKPHLSLGLCRSCYWKQHRKKNPDHWREYLMKSRYGITMEEYKRKLKKQHYKCAICLYKYTRKRFMCIDHDHQTGKVRGLLCDSCNKNVGVYEKMSIKIKKYLGRYK